MKKIITTLLCINLIFNGFSQEKVFEYNNENLKQFIGVTNAYHFISPIDSAAFFFFVGSGVHGIFCDKQYSIQKTMKSDQKEHGYNNLLGNSMGNNMINLYFSGKKTNEVYAVTFDPENDKTYGSLIPIIKSENEIDEVYIGAIDHNNSLFLLFINKKESQLKLYQINYSNLVITQTFDISPNFYKQFFKESFDLVTIKDDIFYRPSETYKSYKLSSFADKIILTLDNNSTGTTLISITPKENKLEIKSFNNNDGIIFNEPYVTKSLYYKNFLFQIRTSNDQLVFTIRNASNDSLMFLKDYLAKIDDFKVLNIILSENKIGYPEEADMNVNRFLKNLSSLDPGISAHQFGDTIAVTIGGYVPPNRGMYASPVPPKRNIYCLGLFNSNSLMQIEGKPGENVFIEKPDLNIRKREFTSGELKFFTAEAYFYGFYNSEEQKYFLYKYPK